MPRSDVTVRWRMRSASFARFSPAGAEAVFQFFWSSISCVSSRRRQHWQFREKEPLTEEEWDWSSARQPQLGGRHPLDSSQPGPASTKASAIPPTVRPPRLRFWTCSDNRICGEPSKQLALCCNGRYVLSFGYGAIWDYFIGGALVGSAFQQKEKQQSPFTPCFFGDWWSKPQLDVCPVRW